ncbi:MAG: succinyl-diaminopimelate desuccinylase [Alphaproteobacteria bacterium]|nr:succinyl-diaminopimelate desuccinylase [Alphaproteobacteria bacterium]MDE1987865.1 succinyl-diaminopimelate desuccinylase [Alphaproteobacteria bacterium]MDE2266974.1 succinyl-diaminopimelate desuccinylase [Alphaproteobacteria bacterium]MDE2499569.1 succinyl-diaminopimelate desuccinylase [Alphaproteobacteria bacterium]
MAMLDPLPLAQALMRCPSVTPADAGALGVLEDALQPLGFACHRLTFREPGSAPVENLYARIGTRAPLLCFAGHTDVVPPGEGWRSDPFAAEIRDGVLYGRGAADMKTAIAAFTAAAARYLAKGDLKGSIGLIITGDEEGDAVNGTRKILDWMKDKGEHADHCIVGEPTSAAAAGDTLKIGRRGSMTVRATVKGTQGHVAYPQRANNPIPALAALVAKLAHHPLDQGTGHFDPSTLAFTTVDVGNPASNVTPAEARATLNIRFNDLHTPDTLMAFLKAEAAAVAKQTGCEIILKESISGVAFLTTPGAFTDLVAKAVEGATGRRPEFSTSGGTSDARFIKNHCPVVELGLPGTTMHKTDECVLVSDIEKLTDIYTALLDAYFANPPV